MTTFVKGSREPLLIGLVALAAALGCSDDESNNDHGTGGATNAAGGTGASSNDDGGAGTAAGGSGDCLPVANVAGQWEGTWQSGSTTGAVETSVQQAGASITGSITVGAPEGSQMASKTGDVVGSVCKQQVDFSFSLDDCGDYEVSAQVVDGRASGTLVNTSELCIQGTASFEADLQ